ncbi:MAG: hypothetical protein H7Y13_02815 [Sphingobacteriaceae bacterium]|nr:hypothetical protein [Sphingobacteriaceae bacterium]
MRKLLPLAVLFFGSCSTGMKYFDPALLYTDISYQPKPVSIDSLKTANYISLGLNQKETNTESGSYDMLTSLQLDISRAHTLKNLCFSYGIFGMMGYMKNKAIEAGEPYYYDKKTFSAAGVRASVNTYVKKGNIDYRFIGAELSYSKEFGDFAAYRKTIYRELNYYSVHNTGLLTAGLTSEVILHNYKYSDRQAGARLFVGRTLNNLVYRGPVPVNSSPEKPKTTNVSIALFGQIKKVVVILEGGSGGNGLVKLGYRF